MPETTEEVGERRLRDDEILVPHKEVKLTNGKRVVVAPWGVTTGKLVFARLEELQPKIDVSDATAYQLLAKAYDEIVDLVALTVDVPRSEIERKPIDGGWTFDDVLEVTEAMLEVCIVRSDGRGALPLLVRLYVKMDQLARISTGPLVVPRPSSGSAPADTSTATSGNASASGKKKRPSSRKS